ncbi:Glycosyltransferase involved in cell wall bisynthesis [Flaviramulus basaltis]|uniref:Glycosyltransferase involved in cell wall bisynthesis n=1 Tax=Flaviramulus basaltis TaxID=369401 RepID=A0A1K2IKJ8_9FLAO|nr:glycosyltransferase family 2 protein [Flaviramulus basaltis]SFZ92961.1 Glycosyltransferase involved in cell wall bisynthesis [Flaviramulus basaltis]
MQKLSIITVNYNNKFGLQRTLDSVLSQAWQGFEYIVIDGGSTDGSKELIESNKKHLSFWVSEPDNGIYNAMNKGINVAKGDYLFFLNSGDDFIDSTSLEKIASCLTGEDIVYFNINQIKEEVVKVKQTPALLSFAYLHHDLPPHQSTFIKKQLFDKFGYYDEDLKIVSDWKFIIIAFIKHNATYKYVDDVFTNFYYGGISTNEDSMILMKKEREIILNKEFPILMNDLKYKFKLERIIRVLRKSKKIQLLIKLGLINKF